MSHVSARLPMFGLLLLCWTAFASAAEDRNADFPEKAEAERIGKRIEASIVAKDMTVMELLMDKDVLIGRTIGKDVLPPDEDQQFRRQTRASLLPSQEIIRTLNDGGTYRFLRAYKREGAIRLLFRMAASVGLNYHELELRRSGPDDRLRVVDIYVYLGCENISDTLRRAYLPVFSRRQGTRELSLADQQYLENLPRLREMAICARDSEWKELLAIYASLPRLVRENKGVLVLRLRAAVNLRSVEIYEQIIEDLYRLYPNTGSPDLVSIDYHQLRGHGKDCLEACDRLDAHLGGDPFIDLMRAGGYVAMNDLVTARGKAWNAAHVEPRSPLPYWVLIKIAIEEQEFDEVARLLLILEYDLKSKLPNLEALAMYRPFVRSDSYETWSDRRLALKDGKEKFDGTFAGRSSPLPGEIARTARAGGSPNGGDSASGNLGKRDAVPQTSRKDPSPSAPRRE